MIRSYRVPITGRLVTRDRNGEGDPNDVVKPSPIIGRANIDETYGTQVVEYDWDDRTCIVSVDGSTAMHARLKASLPQGTSTRRLSTAHKNAIRASTGEAEMTEGPRP